MLNATHAAKRIKYAGTFVTFTDKAHHSMFIYLRQRGYVFVGVCLSVLGNVSQRAITVMKFSSKVINNTRNN